VRGVDRPARNEAQAAAVGEVAAKSLEEGGEPCAPSVPYSETMAQQESTGQAASVGVYRDYIKEQMAREEARKESLERRALAVVTAAGAFATVLFGLAAFSVDRTTFSLSGWAKVTLSFALLGFVASALLAIAVNYPVKYEDVKPDELRDAVQRDPVAQSAAQRMVALTEVKALKKAREKNGNKADLLAWGIGAEGVAVGFVAATVLIIIL